MAKMQNKRYIVISVPTPRGPEYRIYDRVNEATVEGGFETQKWAESVADWMNYKEREKNGKISGHEGRN